MTSGHAADLDHGIGAVGPAQRPDLIDDRFRGNARDVDDMIGAEFFRDVEPACHGIETDDAARAARFGHRGTVQAEQPEALNDDGVAQRDFGGFGHRRHGGDAAIERRCLLVAQLVGKLQDPGAGQDVAVFAQSRRENADPPSARSWPYLRTP